MARESIYALQNRKDYGQFRQILAIKKTIPQTDKATYQQK